MLVHTFQSQSHLVEAVLLVGLPDCCNHRFLDFSNIRSVSIFKKDTMKIRRIGRRTHETTIYIERSAQLRYLKDFIWWIEMEGGKESTTVGWIELLMGIVVLAGELHSLIFINNWFRVSHLLLVLGNGTRWRSGCACCLERIPNEFRWGCIIRNM